MKLKVNPNDIQATEFFQKRFENSALPMLITDKNLFLIDKNSAYINHLPKLRRGSNLKKFFDKKHLDAIKSMLEGEIVYLSVTIGEKEFNANVCRGKDYYFFWIHPLSAMLFSGLEGIYKNFPGRDIVLGESLSDFLVKIAKTCPFKSAGKLIRAVKSRMEYEQLNFFNGSEAICMLEIASESFECLRGITFSYNKTANLLFGRSNDFATLIIATLFVLSEFGDKISVDYNEGGDFATCVISVDNTEGKETQEEQKMWFYLIKLLAEGNLWDATLKSDESSFSVSLALNYSDPFAHNIFSDITLIEVCKIFTEFLNESSFPLGKLH